MLPDPALLLLWGLLAMAVLMGALWTWQRSSGNAGIVDVGWAAGLGILALLYGHFGSGPMERRVLLALLAGGWSFRLATYLFLNRIKGQPEEGRYKTLRATWGASAQSKLFLFFQAQGVLDVILSLSFLAVAGAGRPFGDTWDFIGIALWVIAVGGESIADRQLARWRADPANRGRTCRSGMWAWSRHPNYFFEWIHWWSYVALAAGAPLWWATLLAPALILFLVLKVTGIPPTEAQALKSRGDDYRAYQRTTSAFFPRPPRRDTFPAHGGARP